MATKRKTEDDQASRQDPAYAALAYVKGLAAYNVAKNRNSASMTSRQFQNLYGVNVIYIPIQT